MTKEEIAAVRAMAFNEAANFCNDVAARARGDLRAVDPGCDPGEQRALGADVCAVTLRCWQNAEEIKAGLR